MLILGHRQSATLGARHWLLQNSVHVNARPWAPSVRTPGCTPPASAKTAFTLKGQCHEMNNFFKIKNSKNSNSKIFKIKLSVCAPMVFTFFCFLVMENTNQ
jgi:hypothetical protein